MLTLVALWSLAVYRVTRFVILDTLIAHQRIWLMNLVLGKKPNRAREKVHELLGCPYCVSPYMAAFAVAGTDHYVSVPLPWLQWLAVCAGSLIVWKFVEGDEVKVTVRMGSVVEHRERKYSS